MKKSLLFALLVLCFSSARAENGFYPPPKPLWGSYGLEINNSAGNALQQNPRIIFVDTANYVLAWEDGRSGTTSIYCQKLGTSGNPLWPKEGIRLADGSGNQTLVRLIEDGSGGAIAVWQDYRNGNSDLYAQHISSTGEILWGSQGLAVCKASAGQFASEMIPDGTGGTIIAWYDYRGKEGEDIYAQRINKDGLALWKEDGVAICTFAGTQWYPQLTSDGRDGAIIVWTDGRLGASDNNIYAQRVNGRGEILWEKEGIALCSSSGNQEHPIITRVENEAVIAWDDARQGNADIYAQKMDVFGRLLWQKDGVAVSVAPASQENPRLATDGTGGAIVVWNDNREGENNVYGQRIGQEGIALWEQNGKLFGKIEKKQENPNIIKLEDDSWAILWEEERDGNLSLLTQKININGTPFWQEGGILVSGSVSSQEKPTLSSSKNGDFVVAWQDMRNGNYDIYAQKISKQGENLWGEGDLLICNAAGSVIHQNASLINNGRREILLVSEDGRNGFFNIFAHKLSLSGKLLWGRRGLPLAKTNANQTNPRISPDNIGGALIVWEDSRFPDCQKIYAQRISQNGKKAWTESVPLTKINCRQSKPSMLPDGSGGAIIIWQDEREVLGLKDIYGQRISSSGELLWGKNGAGICKENGEQGDLVILSNGPDGVIIAWTDYRNGERNPDIYAQKVDLQGKLVWKKDGILVCGAPDIQRMPQLLSDGEGGAIVFWTDKGGGSYDLYAQRLSSDGRALWLTDGIPINQIARTQQNPLPVGEQIVVWEDYRQGNWDIYAGAISRQGKLLWGEEGIPIASLPLTQYSPQAIPWKEGGAIVAWEDYRSNARYEIFMQKLDRDGQPAWGKNGVLVKTKGAARSPKLLPLLDENSFVIIWEDYSGGGKAIYGQRFSVDI